MSSIDDFFDFSKEFERQTVTGGTVAGRVRDSEDAIKIEPTRNTPKTTDYAKKYQDELERELRERFFGQPRNTEETIDPLESIYDKYDFDYRRPKEKLAIASSRKHIIDKVRQNTVIVLQGSTGCGKTTQVPQYILDDARARDKYCNIVVAQPRRMAAQTNAQRVCNERGWQIGTVVGYQVGSDQQAHCSEDTRILYCTTGVLLEKLIHNRSLYHYTHIILDEVHERTKEMDFLMVIVYKFLMPTKRVILMSATIDSEKFADYFRLPFKSKSGRTQFESAPIINVDAPRNYEVKKFYLDQLEAPLKNGNPDYSSNIPQLFNIAQPRVLDEQYTWALRLIVMFERMDRMEWMAKDGRSPEEYQNMPKPTVLVFLPGIHEIMVMYRLLEEWKYLNQETTVLRIVLHSTAAPIQAHCAMQQTNRNVRKIILATNIAESSITVPDVKYVIDFCLTRILVTDKETNFSSLRLSWASQNNCEQRAGRTGRVMPGKCFRLVTHEFYEKRMRKAAHPEIIHCPLEDIILKIKVLNMGSPESIIALAMDKPNYSEIGMTILRLKEMSALLKTTNGLIMEMDGDITFIGRVMASLPIDAKLSKLIVYGYCFSVLNECIVIAAALNCTKNIFKMVAGQGVRSYTSLLEWANGSGSDLFAMLNVYNKWSQMHKNKAFGTDGTKAERDQMNQKEKEWTDKFNLEVQALRECETYINDLHFRLKRLKLKPLSHEKFRWKDTEKNAILKVVISGAFYPNYFLRASPNRTQNERSIYNELDGRDPTKTIFLKGFENKKLRHIYTQTIKQEFVKQDVVDNINKVKVTFDTGAQKVYVTFKTDGKKDDVKEYGVACQPGFVLTEVYKAIRMRQVMKPSMRVRVLDQFSDEYRYAKENNLPVDEATKQVRPESESEYKDICFPRMLDRIVKGSITHIENCDEFYLQPESEYWLLKTITESINGKYNDLEPYELPNEIHVGAILAAPYIDPDSTESEYCRAKVLFTVDNDAKNPTFMIQFVDFGNTSKCKFMDLRKLSGTLAQYIRNPPRCFRCALVGIQPSILKTPNGIWSAEATELFRNLTADEVEAEIYSTYEGIARVIIRTANQVNINDLMVKEFYAERCEENYMSKDNHLQREKMQQDSHAMQRTSINYLDSGTLRYLREEDIKEIKPPSRRGMIEMSLTGPYSPIEIQIYPLTNGGKSKTVGIDHHSVNAVMLENEPNDVSYKYLVAVSVCQKNESNTDKINVRQTTMMPHIRGFGPIVAAIFCPLMELARDKSNSHYVSMITGLGYDEQARQPWFPENDMTFDLDTEFTVDDLKKVNEIRHCMNSLLYTEAEQMYAINFDDATKSKLMQKIRELIIDLLVEPRHVIAYEGGKIEWNKYRAEDTITPQVQDSYNIRAIFPLHKQLKLERQDGPELMKLQVHDKELRQLARSERQVTQNILCRVCNDQTIETTVELQRHLLSHVHVDRLAAIESSLKEIYN